MAASIHFHAALGLELLVDCGERSGRVDLEHRLFVDAVDFRFAALLELLELGTGTPDRIIPSAHAVHWRNAMMHEGAVQRLGSVADIMGHHPRARDEAEHVALPEEADHGIPDLPDPERQRALLGPYALCSEAVEVSLPLAGRDVGRIVDAALEHGWTAVDVLDIDVGEV